MEAGMLAAGDAWLRLVLACLPGCLLVLVHLGWFRGRVEWEDRAWREWLRR